ncbi:glycosyltransferase family 2 protein [Deinococcus sp. YIM 77859]|uniref:glycosyltransferase family 2 protein n=1 Tax=Deinococcus sp. YIM 77859 TaxID=1540221 RepID=UPI000554F592|nr:glycosyltransferase family 2 protein [Deinococcus sp. YIM 77859]
MKSFSVIVAIYNAQKYLPETLLSVQRQTYSNFEVVMVDDGSTDDSAVLAQQFCISDPRFRLLSTPHRGISPARNLAVEHAVGDWIAVCDADDTWHPRKLEIQARFIGAWDEEKHGPLAALGTAGYIINRFGQVRRVEDLGIHTLAEYQHWRDEIGQLVMINSSVVFRKHLFEELGGYRADYTPAEDTDLWTRLARRGVVLNLPDRLTFYRMHGENISERRYIRMMLNAERIRVNARRHRAGQPELTYEEFYEHLGENPAQRAALMRQLRHAMHYYIARNRWNNGHRLGGLSSFLRATLIDPRRSLQHLQESYRYHVGRKPTP